MVKDPEAEEIKKVSLAHCVKLLTNREPKPKFKEDIELKKLVHEERRREIVEDEIEFSTEIFENSLKAVKVKHF